MKREKIKSEILELIDDNYSNWRKAAFYSDPEVVEVLDRLQRVWEEEGMKGYPIDYASDEELALLYDKARTYAYMPEDRARSIVFGRQGGDEEEQGSSLRRFLRRLLG